MSGEVNLTKDWELTLEDRRHKRFIWMWCWLGLLATLILGGSIGAGFYIHQQPDPDPRCPGIVRLMPGQTVSITCPPRSP